MPETLPPPSPESLVESVNTVEKMRDMREREAERAGHYGVQRLVYSLDRSNTSDLALQKVPDTARYGYSIGMLSYNELVGFDGLGVEPLDVLKRVEKDNVEDGTPMYVLAEGNEEINVFREGRGLSINFSSGIEREPDYDNPKKPDLIDRKIKERFASSPAHRALSKMRNEVIDQGQPLGSIKTETFDPEEDRLGTLAMLSDLGFVGHWPTSSSIDYGESLDSFISEQEKYDVFRIDEGDNVTYIYTDNGIQRQLTINSQSGECSIGFQQVPDYFYNERANQSEAESVPFVETECAKEMFETLDSCGLMMSPQYQAEMLRIGESERFGSVYTQMSREVSKWVNNTSRQKLSNLFAMYNPKTHAKGSSPHGFNSGEAYHEALQSEMTQQELQDQEDYISRKIASIDTSEMNEPARILFEMIKDCISRDGVTGAGNFLPVTKSQIQINGGACFDVASYYIGAAGDRTGLKSIKLEGVSMLEKTHGAHTFMLQEEAVLNGVRLPKGTLMQKGEDGGWAALRLTPFCFDSEKDRNATGPEMAKSYKNEEKSIRVIGGTALTNLILNST